MTDTSFCELALSGHQLPPLCDPDSGVHVLSEEGYLHTGGRLGWVVYPKATGKVGGTERVGGEGKCRLARLHLGVLPTLVDEAPL
jgi:hypothetical protein